MSRYQRNRILILVMALLLQGCALSGGVQPTPEPVKLQVVRVPYLTGAPIFIADEEGYFDEQGLEVEFHDMRLSSQAIPALAQGEIDVIPGSLYVGQLAAIASGSGIKYVADNVHFSATGCPQLALLVRRALLTDGSIGSLVQLRGQRFSVTRHTFTGYVAEKMVQESGLSLDDFALTDVSSAAEFDALEKGAIDLAMAGEPWVTRIVQAGHAVPWVGAQEVLPDAQYAMILYGPSLLDENHDAGTRFMMAYLKAVRQYNEGKTERNVEILAKHTGLDREVLEKACWPSIRSDGQINVQSILDFQAWAVEKGYLDSPVTEEQFWDPSFAEYANEVLGTPSQ